MRFTKVAATMISCTMLLTSCGTAVDGGEIVMTVGDIGINESEFNYYMTTYKENMDMGEAKKTSLEYCEKNHMIVAVGKAMGVTFDEETQASLDKAKENVVSNYDKNGGYNKFLKENNLTDEYIDTLVSVTGYSDGLKKMMETKEYTDEEKRAYFKENYRRAKHILISTKDKSTNEDLPEDKQEEAKAEAESLLQRAKSGEDFDSLVSEYSDDSGSSSKPDGYVFTDGEMVSEFEDGVDSINAGEFILVKSTYGYHVIERLALDEGSELFETEYSNIADKLSTVMENKAFEEQVYKWAEEKGVTVTVNQEVLDKIE